VQAAAMETTSVRGARVDLPASHWPGAGAPVVLLHAGVADRRSWQHVAPALAPHDVWAYDRRGYGEADPVPDAGTHLDDLLAVLDATGPAWLVGNSMGGALAFDAAVTAPDKVLGLVVVGTAVSGAPWDEFEVDEVLQQWEQRFAEAGDDLDAQVRLNTWLWLDGPAEAEGRVAGEERELAADMARRTLAHRLPGSDDDNGVEAWSRLGEVAVPTTVVVGDLDEAIGQQLAKRVADAVPGARHVVLRGTAHLPMLDAPGALVDVLRDALG
jgi:pimeloyl-ACP methyl ester carboxylesterase